MLVPGDTNSTLAGALAAAKMGIPVAHVESGCRSFDTSMPEEVNRRITDHCSDVLFCVSSWARDQLLKEGIESGNIELVGDTMFESVMDHLSDIESDDIRKELGVDSDYLVLAVHRAENTDNAQRLTDIFKTIINLDRDIIFPCHPRTKNRLREIGLLESVESKIRLIEPIGYFSMLRLLRDADIVLTDSGGIQKEAFWLDTPCVTLRENTEWRETIELGWNKLVGANPEYILSAINGYTENPPERKENPYDFGGASKNILEIIEKRFG